MLFSRFQWRNQTQDRTTLGLTMHVFLGALTLVWRCDFRWRVTWWNTLEGQNVVPVRHEMKKMYTRMCTSFERGKYQRIDNSIIKVKCGSGLLGWPERAVFCNNKTRIVFCCPDFAHWLFCCADFAHWLRRTRLGRKKTQVHATSHATLRVFPATGKSTTGWQNVSVGNRRLVQRYE